jgi:hypothetical protein
MSSTSDLRRDDTLSSNGSLSNDPSSLTEDEIQKIFKLRKNNTEIPINYFREIFLNKTIHDNKDGLIVANQFKPSQLMIIVLRRVEIIAGDYTIVKLDEAFNDDNLLMKFFDNTEIVTSGGEKKLQKFVKYFFSTKDDIILFLKFCTPEKIQQISQDITLLENQKRQTLDEQQQNPKRQKTSDVQQQISDVQQQISEILTNLKDNVKTIITNYKIQKNEDIISSFNLRNNFIEKLSENDKKNFFRILIKYIEERSESIRLYPISLFIFGYKTKFYHILNISFIKMFGISCITFIGNDTQDTQDTQDTLVDLNTVDTSDTSGTSGIKAFSTVNFAGTENIKKINDSTFVYFTENTSYIKSKTSETNEIEINLKALNDITPDASMPALAPQNAVNDVMSPIRRENTLGEYSYDENLYSVNQSNYNEFIINFSLGKNRTGGKKVYQKDKILNPKTNRYVLKTGKIGQELLKQLKETKPKKILKSTKEAKPKKETKPKKILKSTKETKPKKETKSTKEAKPKKETKSTKEAKPKKILKSKK